MRRGGSFLWASRRTEIVSPSPTKVTVPYEISQDGDVFPGSHGPLAPAAAEGTPRTAQTTMSRPFTLRIKAIEAIDGGARYPVGALTFFRVRSQARPTRPSHWPPTSS